MSNPPENLLLFPGTDSFPDADPWYYERRARGWGYRLVAGVDEAGRGPLAGPVVAAAVILPENARIPGVRDSKQMTEKARGEAFDLIGREAVAVGIGVVSHRTIDRENILKASLEAMRRAVGALEPCPDFLFVDGIHPVAVALPQRCLKKGDRICRSISAASVMAKEYRDRIMRSYHRMYPAYGFAGNKGYGTRDHLAALRRLGPCPVHRLTFRGTLTK